MTQSNETGRLDLHLVGHFSRTLQTVLTRLGCEIEEVLRREAAGGANEF